MLSTSAFNMLYLSEEVRESVTKRLQKALIFTISTSESNPESNEEVREPHKKHVALISGTICTADLKVLKKVTWPRELVYTTEGKLVHYEDLSVSLFVNGYMGFVDTKKPALRSVMSNPMQKLMLHSEIYCWAPVHTSHSVAPADRKWAEHSCGM